MGTLACDPVCGMLVAPERAVRLERAGYPEQFAVIPVGGILSTEESS